MRAIGKTMTGEGRPEFFQRIADEITKDIGQLGASLRDKIRAVARANDVPKRVQNAVFSFSDPNAPKGTRKKRSALVGVRKGAPPRRDPNLYVEWKGSGKTIGMSLATIFEKGTRKQNGNGIRGKYYFLLSVKSMQAKLIRRATDIYKSAVDRLNKSNGN